MMSKREHKLLMADFDRMDVPTAERVARRLQEYILATCAHRRTLFCLETVPLDDPVLRYIREWIDEGVCRDEEKCEDTVTFLSKVCRLCNSKDGVRVCGRCERVYYCSKGCQVSDWRRHKLMCKRECKEVRYLAVAGTGVDATFAHGGDSTSVVDAMLVEM
jgi:hypothetical protein